MNDEPPTEADTELCIKVHQLMEQGTYSEAARAVAAYIAPLREKLAMVHGIGLRFATMKTLDHPDSRLIEAAPDLLAALLPMVEGTAWITNEHVAAARAAIAKATPIPLDKSPTL